MRHAARDDSHRLRDAVPTSWCTHAPSRRFIISPDTEVLVTHRRDPELHVIIICVMVLSTKARGTCLVVCSAYRRQR